MSWNTYDRPTATPAAINLQSASPGLLASIVNHSQKNRVLNYNRPLTTNPDEAGLLVTTEMLQRIKEEPLSADALDDLDNLEALLSEPPKAIISLADYIANRN